MFVCTHICLKYFLYVIMISMKKEPLPLTNRFPLNSKLWKKWVQFSAVEMKLGKTAVQCALQLDKVW